MLESRLSLFTERPLKLVLKVGGVTDAPESVVSSDHGSERKHKHKKKKKKNKSGDREKDRERHHHKHHSKEKKEEPTTESSKPTTTAPEQVVVVAEVKNATETEKTSKEAKERKTEGQVPVSLSWSHICSASQVQTNPVTLCTKKSRKTQQGAGGGAAWAQF